jgi:uncharacterized cupin superfamily protein
VHAPIAASAHAPRRPPTGVADLWRVERFNVFDAQYGYTPEEDPAGYRVGHVRFGPRIGARRLGGTVYELPTGQSICPYHWEAGDEELLIVLEGRPSVRHPDGEEELSAGDVVCFPEGPAGAHRISNHAAETARVLMFSTQRTPAVTAYPDGDKVGLFNEDPKLSLLFRRGDAVDYYLGETGESGDAS